MNKIKKLKQDYDKLVKKYRRLKLPSFNQLNQEFGIELLAEHETEILSRLIRHRIHERVESFARLLERLLVPHDSILFLYVIKQLPETDKHTIEVIIRRLAKLIFDSLAIETNDYNEKAEAEFIAKAYREWKKIRANIAGIVSKIRCSFDEQTQAKFKHYFG